MFFFLLIKSCNEININIVSWKMYKMSSRKFSLCVASFFAILVTSSALKCYQCNGSDPSKPFQCNEWLSSDIDIEPEPCDEVYEAKYCIKHIGRFEGGIGAKRYCSSLDLGNYCNYVKQPGDTLTYRSCVYTCTGDGCNPASNGRPNLYVILFTVLLGFLGIKFGIVLS